MDVDEEHELRAMMEVEFYDDDGNREQLQPVAMTVQNSVEQDRMDIEPTKKKSSGSVVYHHHSSSRCALSCGISGGGSRDLLCYQCKRQPFGNSATYI